MILSKSKRFFCSKISKIITNDLNIKKSQPVIAPIVLSTTYKIDNLEEVINENFTYSRANNPTRNLLETNLAILENAKYCLSFSSGSASLTTLSHLLDTDDEILASHDLYGGSKRFFNTVLKNKVNYYNFTENSIENLCKKFESINTIKIVFIETPTNPLLDIISIDKISKICKMYNKILIVDNTFMSPIYQNPLDDKADIVLHSCSKYLSGHSDIIMGCLMLNNDKLYERLKYLQNSLGAIPSPFDCYLMNRSIKTLDIRMEKHQQNAMYISEKLNKHPKIRKVIYPGLISDKLPINMKGYGGIISFYLEGNYQTCCNFTKKLQNIPLAESLGGIETLINHPYSMTHASININEKKYLGITDNMFRLSVGIEDKDYIWKDIKNALEYS